METIITHQERKNKKRGWRTSIMIHIALIILALLPILTYPDPPPGQEGILVNLGLPDMGEGEENAGPSEPTEAVEEDTPDQPEAQPEEVVEEQPPREVEVEKPEPVKEKEVIRTEDPEAVALKKKREEEAQKAREAELERQRQEAEAERQRLAEAERQRKAEAARKQKEAEANKLKNEIGGLFGDGSGKGKTGTAGNQGDPDGDPNANKLEGISTGSGTVGGGLGNRGVLNSPRITDNSQKAGTVVVKVCVNNSGSVVSAEFTQRGSTTADSQLKSLAVANAKKWKFSTGSVDRQCGTITYRFKVK